MCDDLAINMGLLGRIGDALTKVDERFSDDPYIIGKRFEDHVESLFSKKWFSIIEKTHSAKTNEQRYVESSLNPDIIFRYNGKGGGDFAVECKFRTEASFDRSGRLRLFKPSQMQRYREFSQKRNIPVFIVIGLEQFIDDEYEEPLIEEYMFNIPLNEIKYDSLYPSVLTKYERPYDKEFFWKNGELS